MRLEETALDAGEKLLTYYELDSSVTSSRNFKNDQRKTSLNIGTNLHKTIESLKLLNFFDTKRPGSLDRFNVINAEEIPLYLHLAIKAVRKLKLNLIELKIKLGRTM